MKFLGEDKHSSRHGETVRSLYISIGAPKGPEKLFFRHAPFCLLRFHLVNDLQAPQGNEPGRVKRESFFR